MGNTGMVPHNHSELMVLLIMSECHGKFSLVSVLHSLHQALRVTASAVHNPRLFEWKTPSLNPVPSSVWELLVGVCSSPPWGASRLQFPSAGLCWFNPFPGPRLHRDCCWCTQGLLLATPQKLPNPGFQLVLRFHSSKCWHFSLLFSVGNPSPDSMPVGSSCSSHLFGISL